MNTPSLELAMFAVNTIYNPNESMDWIHVKILPFFKSNGELKFLLKVSNPSFDPLPPVKIFLTLRPLHFDFHNGNAKITSNICENLIVDPLPENGSAKCEVFTKNHCALLQAPLSLTVTCFPHFNSYDSNDWHSPPLYTTVLTSLDLLLNKIEIRALHITPKIIPLSSTPKDSILEMTAAQAIKLVLKELKDITESDVLESLLHFKCSNYKKPFTSYIFMDNTFIEVQIIVSYIVPRISKYVFKIQIFTNASEKTANCSLFYQLQKKIMVLQEDSSFPVHRTSRPASLIWKPQNAEPQSYDFAYVQE
uniref:Uncharacterized protein n=1 Tax=Panagrolaimus davidi TaxID=227884 RepID=A0A914PFC6_9BILA